MKYCQDSRTGNNKTSRHTLRLIVASQEFIVHSASLRAIPPLSSNRVTKKLKKMHYIAKGTTDLTVEWLCPSDCPKKLWTSQLNQNFDTTTKCGWIAVGKLSAAASTSLCYISLFLGCWNIDDSLVGQLTKLPPTCRQHSPRQQYQKQHQQRMSY